MTPVLIIHGGAGMREGRHAKLQEYADHLKEILTDSYPQLLMCRFRHHHLWNPQ